VNLRKVALVDWASGLCGAALIVTLFLPWYRKVNAWQALAVNDVILLLAGAMAIALVVLTATHSTNAVPIAAAVFTALLGLIAAILAVVRLIWPPDLGLGPTDRAVGVWLGAPAAIAMTVAALRSVHSERRGERADVPARTVPAPRGSEA
jgi:hypothetical protein